MIKLARTGVRMEFSARDFTAEITLKIVEASISVGGTVHLRDAGRYFPDMLIQLAKAGRTQLTLSV
jgi:hypothetical protein